MRRPLDLLSGGTFEERFSTLPLTLPSPFASTLAMLGGFPFTMVK